MTKPLKRSAVALGIVAILALVFFSIQGGKSNSAQLFPPLPQPNGYEDFLQASQLIDAPVPDLTNSAALVLRPLVQRNQAALELVRTGLSRQSQVPLQFNLNYLTTHSQEIGNLKNLARLLVADGISAEADGKFDAASRIFLDVIRLAHAVAQGGFLIDELVAQAIQALGAGHLRRVIGQLDASDVRNLIGTLATMDQGKDSVELIMRRERAYFRKVHGWWLVNAPRLLGKITGKDPLRPAMLSAEATMLRGQAQLRLLILHLALQSHKLEHGSYPVKLAGLAPRHLKAIPFDPFSEQGFVYRIEDAAYRLYSIGPDRKDDGGTPTTARRAGQISQGDILLE